jgi:hypothetical protein
MLALTLLYKAEPELSIEKNVIVLEFQLCLLKSGMVLYCSVLNPAKKYPPIPHFCQLPFIEMLQ